MVNSKPTEQEDRDDEVIAVPLEISSDVNDSLASSQGDDNKSMPTEKSKYNSSKASDVIVTSKRISPVVLVGILIAFCIVSVLVYLFLLKGGTGNGSDLPTKMSTKVEGFDVEKDRAYSNAELYYLDSTEGKIWLYGYYQNSGYSSMLVDDPANEYSGSMIDVSNADGVDMVASGDLVLLGGRYSDDGYTFLAESVAKITQTDVDVFNLYKYPYAKMEILDAPKNVNHGCEHIDLSVKITNIGKISINESDFYAYNSSVSQKYNFVQFTDGTQDISYSFTDAEEIADHGYKDLGIINPGETKELTYGAGGFLSPRCEEGDWNCNGRGGGPNTLCSPDFSFPGGNREVKLAIGYLKPGEYYEYIITSESNPVTLNVLSCECDLTAEN